ncbi:response regulator transcription factor [Acidaminobacter sp. JC074]|uniref:response regulator transcription factor n=1 Tax=Acidaminobacter sp. JC074 TaxID=2530199 RepID=UPI001F0E3F1F|nr:response regulator transcription factor [Acidaminobacter sp. JC074]MCH4888034.1 response regulator transcription factor [Acidaminobacter sp. JC074]
MSKILVVDDEKAIVDILKFHLSKSGYKVLEAYNGAEAVEKASREKPDLVLLDIMIPEINGFEVCNRLRTKMTTPIIMLTAREDVTDKILGLSLGADDYISKPFNIRELLARVDANIRRVQVYEHPSHDRSPISEEHLLIFDNLEINRENLEVKCDGSLIELTAREYELLEYFARHPNKVFTREQLLTDVWNYDYFGDIRTVDVTISRLREKLNSFENKKNHIITKRGFGYYFV